MVKKFDEKEAHKKILKSLRQSFSVCEAERNACLADRRFATIAGAQWESISATSESEKPLSDFWGNKPKIEINKIANSLNKIASEYKNNRVTVEFVQKDDAQNAELCETLQGLYRECEQDSVAEEAYDNAFNDAITGGFGAFRFTHDYENPSDPKNEKQKILIQPIYDADKTVFFDVNARRMDKADANYAFVLLPYNKDFLLEEYSQFKSIANIGVGLKSYNHDRVSKRDESIYIAEYYVKEQKKYKLYKFVNRITGDEFYKDELFLEKNENFEEEQSTLGFEKQEQERKITKTRVRKLIIDGEKVLKDCGYIAGENIPIVPVYGVWNYIDGQERYRGHVRTVKDAQIIKNVQASALMDVASKSGDGVPIVAPEQIAGYESHWFARNTDNLAYLPINPVKDSMGNPQYMSVLGYTQSPNIPPAVVALLQMTDPDIVELLGNVQKGETVVSNTSGVAIELAQAQIDLNTQIYTDNRKRAFVRAGHIFLGMAKEIYVETDRKIKLQKNDKSEFSLINQSLVDVKTGKAYIKNDIANADLDVAVTVGASSKSKKMAIIKNIVSLMSVISDPEEAKIMGYFVLQNFAEEGMGALADYARQRLVQMGIEKPSQDELSKMQAEAEKPQIPNSLDTFNNAAAEKELAQAEKLRSDTMLSVAKTQETQAKAEQIFHDMGITAEQARMNTMKTFKEMTETAPVPQDASMIPQGEFNVY